MNFSKIFSIIIIIFFTALCFVAIPFAMAQDNNAQTKSLSDILNPKVETEVENLTSTILAQRYYDKCIDKKSLVFDDNEKEIMCSCVSAEMVNNLSIDNFKNLDKDNMTGRDARSKMLAYTYAPCMEYAVEAKARTDCMASGNLYDIVSGKSIICDCVANYLKQQVIDGASYIINIATHYEPMTLEPLEYYWSNNDYYYEQHKTFLNLCRYNFEYKRDNIR